MGLFVQEGCLVGSFRSFVSGFGETNVCVSSGLCRLLAESVTRGVQFALLCQRVRPDPFRSAWEEPLNLCENGWLNRHRSAMPHWTVKSAGRPVATSASSSGQSGHAGGITLTAKNKNPLTEPRWTGMRMRYVWKEAIVLGCTIY